MDQPITLPGDPVKIDLLLAQLRTQHYRVVQRVLLTSGVPLIVIERAPEPHQPVVATQQGDDMPPPENNSGTASHNGDRP